MPEAVTERLVLLPAQTVGDEGWDEIEAAVQLVASGALLDSAEAVVGELG